MIGLTYVILGRVAKNNSNGVTKKDRSLKPAISEKKVEQSQGKKNTPIDITDEDDGNDDHEKIGNVPLESSSLNVQETLICEDRRRIRKRKEQLKKECVALMAQTLHDLQEEKVLENVTPAEYQTIEKLAKIKTGLSIHCYLSKKLVQKLTSTLQKTEMKKKNTTVIPVIEAVRLSTSNSLPLPQVITEEDLDKNAYNESESNNYNESESYDFNESESNDYNEIESNDNDGYESDESLVF